jgi:hypothetical protein
VRKLSVNGRELEVMRGSDIVRDGMFLEISTVNDDRRNILVEVFFSDVDGTFTFTCDAPFSLPLEVIESLIAEARTLLPPKHPTDA